MTHDQEKINDDRLELNHRMPMIMALEQLAEFLPTLKTKMNLAIMDLKNTALSVRENKILIEAFKSASTEQLLNPKNTKIEDGLRCFIRTCKDYYTNESESQQFLLVLFRADIETYKFIRDKEAKAHPIQEFFRSACSFFKGYDYPHKLEAANHLLNPNASFPDDVIDAIRNSRLGKLIARHEAVGALPPQYVKAAAELDQRREEQAERVQLHAWLQS